MGEKPDLHAGSLEPIPGQAQHEMGFKNLKVFYTDLTHAFYYSLMEQTYL